jgi:cbb3-type cytochrome oxidase subunit 3
MMGYSGLVWWTAGIGLLLLVVVFWLFHRRSQKSSEPVS